MDNLFLNVWPSKPDGINGSERIANVPELSHTLKTCAALRKQFLPYFTEGVLIGNCLLARSRAPGVRLSAYVLPDRVLAIVLNQGAGGVAHVPLRPGPLVARRHDVRRDGIRRSGAANGSRNVPASGTLQTRKLRPLEMTVLEFVEKQREKP